MCSQKRLFCCQKSVPSIGRNGNTIPMDRGWAWVIVLASAGLFCLIAGTFKCFGILKIQIQENFPDCGQDVTLWMLSSCSIVSLLSGLGFSWLVNKTSHRTAGMIGGALCSTGIFLTAFATDCYFMFLSLVTIYSTGTGGVMVVVFSAFADYFSKHRGLAVGVMASGSGLGSLVVPKLLSYLFDKYTFRDALICYAAVFLQSIFLSALLRPSSYYKQPSPTNTKDSDSEDSKISDEEQDKFLTNIPLSDDVGDFQDYNIASLNSTLPETALEDETSCSINNSQACSLDNNNKPTTENTPRAKEELTSTEFVQLYGSVYSSLAAPFVSTHTLNDLDNGNKHVTTETSNATTKTSSALKKPTTGASYNWRLWLNSQVLLIGLLVFFAVNSINLIFTTAPSFAQEKNVEVDVVATIMTLTGTGEIVFRVVHGFLADRRIISALTQICIIMLACTVAALLCAFLHGVVGIGIMYAVMSLCGTTIYSLLPIVIIEQIGKENLVTVLGIFYVYQALAFVVSTLVANKLHAYYNTWENVFYYIGACYFMATTIGIITYIYYKYWLKKRTAQINHIVGALT